MELWNLIWVITFTPAWGGVSNSGLSGMRRLVIVLSVCNIFIVIHPTESVGLRLLLYAGMFSTQSRLPASLVSE